MTNPQNNSGPMVYNSTVHACHEYTSLTCSIFVPYYLELLIKVFVENQMICFGINHIKGVSSQPIFANGRK